VRRFVVGGGVAAIFLILVIASIASVPISVRGAPTVDAIVIVDGPNGTGSWVSGRDYMFGDSDTFWAAGYNATSGFVGDVPVYWLQNLTTGILWANTSYGPSVRVHAAGFGTTWLEVLDYLGGNRTYLANITGRIHVSVDNVDSVVVRSDRGGMGTWVGPTTYEVGDYDKFYAAAYNDTTGFLGDIFSNWASSNASVGYVYPASPYPGGQCDGTTGAICYPSVYFYARAIGFTYVTAEPIGTTLSNTTGKLTVTAVAIDYLQIRDAPNGGGTVLGDRTYYPREQDTFYAASYNQTLGYRGDVVGDWTSNDSAVCEVRGYYPGTAHGSSVQLLLKAAGVCSVTVTATTVSGVRTNTTGALTVLPRTVVTVDDSGGADFTKIQDAVDFASDGFTIFIYDGSYAEHVVVQKELEIAGESRDGVVIDGGGTGTALFVGADRVVVHNLTIKDAAYGVFQDHTNNTRLYDTTIRDYGTGLYNNFTLNAWVAHNLITQGQIGVVAFKAYDDAIRYNEISFNTVYGAKGYNARLRNCFNWNYLHDNKKGYFYDPTTDLPPYEFDGNVLVDNEIGVEVADSSAIYLTNNAISGGSVAVLLLNSSSEIRSNTLASVPVGIEFHGSSSNLTGNTIAASGVGITGDRGAPRIEGNDIRMSSGLAMDLTGLDGAVISGNDVHGGTILISDSRIAVLGLINSNVILADSTVQTVVLDANSRVEVRHTIRVRAVDANGVGLGAAAVGILDARGVLVSYGATGSDGTTPPLALTTEVRTPGGVQSRNPFTIEVAYGSSRAVTAVTIAGAGDVVVRVPVGTPAPLAAGLAAAALVSASFGGIFAVERSRYALFAAFAPLYSRLSHDKVLENYNRGRVYEYIELNPGAHFNGILAALDLNNGNLVYHLEVLQKEGLVTSRQEGMFRRFYPRDMQLPPLVENGTTEAQLRVLKAIQEMPGITQKELARFLGLRQSTLAYQIDRLAATGSIAGEKTGRKVRYFTRKPGA